jgi:hypothetical protein
MFNFWYNATMLSAEAQSVIGLRMMTIAMGGSNAQTEAHRMVTEKIAASMGAAATLMSGGTVDSVVAGYRKRVRANYRRLSRT